MPRVRGWTEQELLGRERVFEGLIAKAVKMSLRPLSATLNRTLVAAGAPTISPEPGPVGPVLSPAQTTVVTATWTHYVDNELFPYLAQTFVDAAGAVRAGTETALDVSVPPVTDSYAVAYLAAASNRLVNVGDVVWSAVRDQLVEGYAAGESTHQLAARVREVAGFTKHRAVAVARTEVVGAANAGSLAQLQLAGFTDEECSKRWLATEDERTRIAHHVADGQTVPLNQPFSVGGEGLQFPGDPRGRADNIIQCRCTLEYVFADDAEPEEDVSLTAAGLHKAKHAVEKAFDEVKHPRAPKGGAHGGEFVKKGIGVGQVAALKPIKVNTKVIYNTKYKHMQVVAEKPGATPKRLVWDDVGQKFILQSWGGAAWHTAEVHGKGTAYKKFSQETGWVEPDTSPKGPASNLGTKDWIEELKKMQDLETTPPKPSLFNAPEAPPAEPRTSLEAIQAVQNMNGPEFVQFMNDHLDELGSMWNDLDPEEKNTLKAKAIGLQVNPEKKGFGKNDFSYLTPWSQILDLEQGKVSPSTPEALKVMSDTEVNTWFDHLTKDVYDGFTDAQKAIIADVVKKQGAKDNIHPAEAMIALSGSDVTLAMQLDDLTTDELKNWLYDHVYPEAWNDLIPDEDKDVIWDAAVAHGPQTVQVFNDLLHGVGSGSSTFDPNDIPGPYASPTKVNEYFDQLTIGHYNSLSPMGKAKVSALVDSAGSQGNTHPYHKFTEILNADVSASKTPTKSAAVKALPLGLPGTGQMNAWPDPKTLQFTGQTVGTHGSKVYFDPKTNKKYLFKPTPAKLDHTIAADIAVSKLQKLLLIPAPELRAETIDGVKGSLQEWIPSKPAFPGKFGSDLKKLSPAEINNLVAAQAFDWLVSNHDSHADNFLKSEDGQLIAIDKTQAFKFFPYDKLNSTYHPNTVESPPIYNQLWTLFEQGQIDIPSPSNGSLGPGMELWDMQHIPDDQYKAILRPYAEAAVKRGMLMNFPNAPGAAKISAHPNDVEEFLTRAVQRKNTLLDSFSAFYQEELKKRQANGFGGFKPPTVQQVAPQNAPPLKKSQPLKITTTFIYKTPHPIGVPIAERALPSGLNQQLRWNGKNYELWSNKTGIFKFEVAMGKGATYEHLAKSNIQGWMTPGTPSQPGVSTPSISSPGQAVTATQKITEIPKISKFDAATIQAQYGLVGHISNDVKDPLFQKFKKGTSLGTITLKSTAPTTFKALALSVAEWNQTHPTFKPVNALQLLKIIDEHLTPSGGTNQNLYEKKIVDWLGTAGGKKNAPGFVNWAEATAAQTLKLGTPQQPKTSGKIYTVEDVLKLDKIGTPSTGPAQFTVLSLGEASAMHKKMQGSTPWTEDQITAIKKYTGSYYTDMNSALRHKPDYTGPAMKDAYNLQTAMRPVPQDFMVHRGTVMKQFGVTSTSQLQQLVGKTVTDRGFMSTSVGGESAFSGEIALTIQVPKGTPGAYVKSKSSHPSENEFILAAGTKFQIMSVTNTGSYKTHVVVRVVP